MVFFKCTANRPQSITREQLRHEKEEHTPLLAETTQDLFLKDDNESMVFTAALQEGSLTLGIIAATPEDARKQAEEYLRRLPIAIDSHRLEEITYCTLESLVYRADHSDFISDADDVMENFRMNNLSHHGRATFGEAMIDTALTAEGMQAVAEEHLFTDTLTPELDRIRQGCADTKAVGHPVHYLVSCDDRHARKRVYKALLSALYQQGRIRNQRYSYVNYDASGNFPGPAFEALYHCSEGGAVVVRFGDADEGDGEFSNRGAAIIDALCEIAVRYKNRVLTILCLPAAANRTKEVFFHHWGNTAFVELREDIIDGVRAETYLKNKAKTYHLRADKRLTAGVSDKEKTYAASYLNALFDEWHSHKLRHRVYPQYRSATPSITAVQKSAPTGSAYERLQALIGLTEAKEMMNKALNYFKLQKLFADRGIPTEQPSMHMVFTGNPGTAKTTVARLFAEIMRENGLLSRGDLIEVGRADLVGKYVGHTAPLVKAAFAKAKGGVLFIDEAYSLVDGREGLYGDEAINTIVQEMENHRQDTIVIFAGYPDEMEGFLERNPGLRSRIAFHIPFADYSADQLCAIADHIAHQQKLTLSTEALRKLQGVFTEAVKQSDFGNGRYARNLIEKAKMAQANRLMSADLTTITDDQLHTLCAEDIDEPRIRKPEGVAIGFCA